MKKYTSVITVFFAGIFFTPFSFAQNLKYCGQAEAEERIKNENPQLYQQILQDKKELENYTKAYAAQRTGERGTVYTIPVVFHIIHNYGPENISDEQVYDAVRIINEDYRKRNADTSNIVDAFKAIVGDAEIEFRLAQKDPQGNCTSGIIRKASLETYKGINEFGNTSTSDVSRWPRNKYLNIWVVKAIESGAAGYTYTPGTVNSAPKLDGIMIQHNYVGSIGTGNDRRSRALSHEIGHWFNLEHTWGGSNTPGAEGNCNDDDGVTDTPNTIGWTICDLNGNSCNTLNNVQNYMEYSYCSKMFTQGQVARMRAAVTSSIAERKKLWQPANLASTGVTGGNILCKAEFITSRTEICEGETINFTDASFNNPSSWNWVFTGGSPSVSSDKNPTVTYNTPGKYNVELTVSDGTSGKSTTKSNYITVLPLDGHTSLLIEGFESAVSLSAGNWFVNSPEGGATWEIADVGATGSKSIKINNTSAISGFNEISSTSIDLTSIPAVHVSFKVAFAQKSSGNTDELKFFVSKNCGENWAMRWSRSGGDLATAPAQSSSFTPNDPGHWMQYIITNLPTSYLVSNFRLKFQFTGNGGNNIYIDDINVYDPATVGVNEQDQQTHFTVYPNPFWGEAKISFSLDKNEQVKLSVLDLLGKESVIIPPRNLAAGSHTFIINKNDLNLSEGIYFIRFAYGKKVSIKKFILN